MDGEDLPEWELVPRVIRVVYWLFAGGTSRMVASHVVGGGLVGAVLGAIRGDSIVGAVALCVAISPFSILASARFRREMGRVPDGWNPLAPPSAVVAAKLPRPGRDHPVWWDEALLLRARRGRVLVTAVVAGVVSVVAVVGGAWVWAFLWGNLALAHVLFACSWVRSADGVVVVRDGFRLSCFRAEDVVARVDLRPTPWLWGSGMRLVAVLRFPNGYWRQLLASDPLSLGGGHPEEDFAALLAVLGENPDGRAAAGPAEP